MTSSDETNDRLFFAIWPDANVLSAVHQQFDSILSSTTGRILPDSNWHITLCFLGSVSRSVNKSLIETVDQISVRRFALVLDTIRSIKRAQMIWIQASVVPKDMLDLVNQLKLSATQFNLVSEERTFLAHLTVMRKVARVAKLPEAITPIHWNVTQFALVRSVTHTTGAEYETIRKWDLQ